MEILGKKLKEKIKENKIDLNLISEYFDLNNTKVCEYDELIKNAKAFGCTFYNGKDTIIILDSTLDGEQFIKTFSHEVAHAIVGYDTKHSYEHRKYNNKVFKLMSIGKY